MAALRQSLGIRAAGNGISDRVRRASSISAATDGTPRGLVSGRNASLRSRMTRRSRAGAGDTSTRCGCGPRASPTPIQLATFNEGDLVGAIGATRARRSDLARALSERRHDRRDRNCGCARSISSPRHQCTTSSAAISQHFDELIHCRNTSPSNSTTHTRQSPSPSSCASWSTSMILLGTMPGASPRAR